MNSANYKYRNGEIIEYMESRGLIRKGRGTRDLYFGKSCVTDQIKNFAIYSAGTDDEKITIEKIFRKYNPDSIDVTPERSSPRRICARWNHSEKDYEIMYSVLKELNDTFE